MKKLSLTNKKDKTLWIFQIMGTHPSFLTGNEKAYKSWHECVINIVLEFQLNGYKLFFKKALERTSACLIRIGKLFIHFSCLQLLIVATPSIHNLLNHLIGVAISKKGGANSVNSDHD